MNTEPLSEAGKFIDHLNEVQTLHEKLSNYLNTKFPIQEDQPKRRVITKMAKNTAPGDLVDIPGVGWREITGWSMMAGYVTFSAENMPLMEFKANERVRIQRQVMS